MGKSNSQKSEFHTGNYGGKKEVAHFSRAERKTLPTLNYPQKYPSKMKQKSRQNQGNQMKEKLREFVTCSKRMAKVDNLSRKQFFFF